MTDTAILGLGHLGRPLAEALYLRGSQVAALKRTLTSDDICLPIALDSADLNRNRVWQQPFWREHWAAKSTWVCLLPPSALSGYAETLRRWITLAEYFQVAHLVYTSSISVYGDTPRICDEHTPPQPHTPSARACLAAENLLQAAGVPHVTILRLGGLYSAERHPLAALMQRQPIPRPQAAANMLHRDRAVSALVQAVMQPNGRRIRNILETPPPARADFYRCQATLLGLPEPQFDNDPAPGKTVVSRYHDFDTAFQAA